jgi:hypothetical protein
MKRKGIREWERPYGRDDLALVREGRDGVCWRARDGLEVRLATPERATSLERERLSVVGVLHALVASGVERR